MTVPEVVAALRGDFRLSVGLGDLLRVFYPGKSLDRKDKDRIGAMRWFPRSALPALHSLFVLAKERSA